MSRLGEGSYGVVEVSKDNPTLAIKKYKCHDIDGLEQNYVREVGFLKTFIHPHIIACRGFSNEYNKCQLVMLRMETDVCRWLQNNIASPELCIKWMCQTLDALRALHDRGLFHRDIKPQNMLLDSNNNIYLCDFGCITACDKAPAVFTSIVCTLRYRPLEVLFGNNTYTSAIDVWSAAVSFVEMVIGEPWIVSNNQYDQICKICSWTGTPSASGWAKSLKHFDSKILPKYPVNKRLHTLLAPFLPHNQDVIEVLHGMLNPDPDKRLSASDALLRLDPNYLSTPLIVKKIHVRRPPVFTYYRQREITLGMRKILLQWMFEVNFDVKCTQNVYFCAVSIIDRYLSVEQVTKCTFQLVGSCALLLASKIYSVIPLSATQLVLYSDDAFTVSEIHEKEKQIFSSLSGQIDLFCTEYPALMKAFVNDETKQLLSTYLLVMASTSFAIWRNRFCLHKTILISVSSFIISKGVLYFTIPTRHKKSCRQIYNFFRICHESKEGSQIRNLFTTQDEFIFRLKFMFC